MKELSFIIVNYRSEKYLEKCVHSILNKVSNLDFEIIIVNNDKKRLDISDFESIEDIFIKEVNKNIGFGKACNLGAADANGDVLCFINPDTELLSGNIKDLVAQLGKESSIGVIGPRIVEKAGQVQLWSAGKKPSIQELLRNNIGFARHKEVEVFDMESHVDWITGAAMFINKEVFTSAEGFDEGFFMYFEDVDLCLRVKRLGKDVRLFPGVEFLHVGGGSISSLLNQKKQYYISQEYYFQKHFSKAHKYLIRLMRVLHH
ncbi:glycosyltransferase family 2 protein [Patescibacteria group bacterium]